MPATVLGKSRGTCFAASPTRMGKAGLAVSFMQQVTGSLPLQGGQSPCSFDVTRPRPLSFRRYLFIGS